MMGRPATLVVLLAAGLVAAHPAAAATGASGQMPLVLQAEHQNVTSVLDMGGPEAFVYNPRLLTGAAGKAATKTFGPAGSSSSRMAQQFPALAGFGIAQTYFELAPCAHRAPHTHPRASGLLFVIAANALEVGFALEDASQAVVNNVTTGASAVFPQGLLHYQQNRDCRNIAKFTISYNADDPGTVNQAQALFALPTEVIAAALNTSAAEATTLLRTLPAANIYPGAIATNSDCVAACAAAGIAVANQGDSAGTPLPAVLAAAEQATAAVPAPAPAPAPAPQSAVRTAAVGVAGITLAAVVAAAAIGL